VTVQLFTVPVQLPVQPVNVEPGAGAAVKVMAVPLANGAEHAVPQEMPVGALVTVPTPVPVLFTVSEKLCSVNVAVTVCAALIVTVHVPVPVQPPPLQPVNVEPAVGVAVNVTAVPLTNGDEHVVPQEMPAGALVTVPDPVPALVTVSVKACSVNVALTVCAAFTVTVQVPEPVQPPPLQPVNVEPVAGAAVSVTEVPLANGDAQVVPQEMPAGALVTVPDPVPALVTVSVKGCSVNVAVTVCAAFTVTVQVPVPVQPPPLQPVNVEPAAGAAVKVTAVPLANGDAQVVPQEMPAGALVTVPDPVPALVTVSVKGCSVNVAVTVCAAFTVTVQVPVPVQPPPLQPANVEPVAGVAVRVTAVPLANGEEQVVPHEMPAGELVTVPDPVPALVSVSVKGCSANVAVTVCAAFTVTLQVPVPVQPPPLQPVNVEPVAGVALNVTAVPVVNDVEHVVPQEIPAGVLVTVPLPAPVFVTVSAKDDCTKLAVTVVGAFTVTVQVLVPVQPPLHPVKVEPAAAAAVSVTEVPLANDAEQVAPQEMPAGLLVTVPLPAPAFDTVKVELVDPPVPVTSRETVSPSAVKLTLVLATAVLVGAKRTVTVAVEPEPTRVKGLPETMLNGAATEAVPVTVPVRVLVTVKV